MSLALSSVSSDLNQKILSSYDKNAGIKKIIQELQYNHVSHSSYTWDNRHLRRNGKLVVGQDHGLQSQILSIFYSSGPGGHSGVHATYQRVSTILYWKGLWKSVKEFVKTCVVYQQNKFEHVPSPSLLQPLLCLNPFFLC